MLRGNRADHSRVIGWIKSAVANSHSAKTTTGEVQCESARKNPPIKAAITRERIESVDSRRGRLSPHHPLVSLPIPLYHPNAELQGRLHLTRGSCTALGTGLSARMVKLLQARCLHACKQSLD